MKWYKHKITGRIIDEYTYLHRISKWIIHYFEHMENADDPEDTELENLLA